MNNHTFSNHINADFATTLRTRVNKYFTDNNIKQGANPEMVLKSISAISIYVIPYILMLTLNISSLPVLFILWMIMGFGTAFIGMAVMHDSLHGSYSRRKGINTLVSFSTWIIGVDPLNWKIQHNVLHHSFTNIEHADEDIEPRYIFRFSPNQPKIRAHKFQHFYAFIFYGLSTLIWMTYKDFLKAFKYKKEKLIPSGWKFVLHISQIILRKMVYYFLLLVVPAMVLPYSFGMVFLMFLTMHFVAGNILSFTFQLAHVMETSSFEDGNEKKIEEHRLVHQLNTTSNFGMKSRLLFWFTGGLNHQIEHHLFPNICHIHYRKISKIVQATAREYNITYHSEPTLGSALKNHLKMLKTLGAGNDLVVKPVGNV